MSRLDGQQRCQLQKLKRLQRKCAVVMLRYLTDEEKKKTLPRLRRLFAYEHSLYGPEEENDSDTN